MHICIAVHSFRPVLRLPGLLTLELLPPLARSEALHAVPGLFGECGLEGIFRSQSFRAREFRVLRPLNPKL